MYRRYLKAAPEGEHGDVREVVEKAVRELESAAAGPAPAAATTVAPGTPEPSTAVPAPTPQAPPVAAPVPVPPSAAPALAPAAPEPTTAVPAAAAPDRDLAESKPATLAPAAGIESPATPSHGIPTEPESTGSGLRVAGVLCAVAGLGSIGAGLYYWTRATSLSDSANSAAVYNHNDYDQGRRAEKMQWIFYGAGAGAVVLGAVLYLYGGSSPATGGQRVSVTPMFGPDAAGALARGTF